MRNLRMKSLIIALLAVVLTGCASGSAPLVDLPAPISGHINISNPDSDGNVLVAGSAGAVDGGSMVMVVNETTAGVSAMTILNLLVKPAYAESSEFPSLCSMTGRACAVSETDGSFTVTIPAAIGDSLAIGVIDSSGNWISEVLRRDVPATDTETQTCADEGVNGAVVDIKTLATETSGVVYAMLKQGSEGTPNQLVIGNSTTEGEVFDIEGCHAHSLDVQPTSTGDIAKLVVTSQDDKIVWFGTFDGSDIVDGKYFTLETEPMSVNYASSENGPVVALKDSTSVTLAEISETDGSIVQSMDISISNSGPVEGLTRSSRIGLMEMDDGQFFGMLITDRGSSAEAFVTLFLLNGMHEYATLQNGGDLLFKALETLSDGSLWSYEQSNVDHQIRLALLGSNTHGNFLQTFGIYIDAVPLAKEKAIDSDSLISFNNAGSLSPYQNFELKNIAVAVDSVTSGKDGVITTSKGSLLIIDLIEPTSQPEEILLPGVATDSNLVAISILSKEETAYVADGTAEKAVNIDEVF
jgi:hypothetical protein